MEETDNVVSLSLNWRLYLSGMEFDDQAAFLNENGGIYLWIYEGAYKGVHYIGEAGIFWRRFFTHFSYTLSGFYTIFNPEKLNDLSREGFVRMLNDYCEEKTSSPDIYTPDAGKMAATFFDDVWAERHRAYLKKLKFAFATIEDVYPPLDHQNDMPKLRKEIEAVLMLELKKKAGLSPKAPIGQVSRNPSVSYKIEHAGDCLEIIPDEIKLITGRKTG